MSKFIVKEKDSYVIELVKSDDEMLVIEINGTRLGYFIEKFDGSLVLELYNDRVITVSTETLVLNKERFK
jgi:hypothetical protein